MNGVQRTYSLISSQEHKPISTMTLNNKCEQSNEQYHHNAQCHCCKSNCNEMRRSNDNCFISNKTTNLTYTLDSSQANNNFNLSTVDRFYQTLPVFEDKSQLKQAPLQYSYFNELSIDNLRRFKESKKKSNSLQTKKRGSNSFDDSLKHQKTKQSTRSSNQKQRSMLSATKPKQKTKTFKRDFTDLDRISNSSHPQSLDKSRKEEEKVFKEKNELHFDYNKPYFDMNTFSSSIAKQKHYSNEYLDIVNNQTKIQMPPNQFFSNAESINNNSLNKSINNCFPNDYSGQKQYPYDSQYNGKPINNELTFPNYSPYIGIDNEEEKHMLQKQERDRKFRLEKEQLRERRRQNEDLMQREIENEIRRNAYQERRRYQNEIEENEKRIIEEPEMGKRNEERRNHQLPKKIIRKYYPNSAIELNHEPQMNQSEKTIKRQIYNCNDKSSNKQPNKTPLSNKGNNIQRDSSKNTSIDLSLMRSNEKGGNDGYQQEQYSPNDINKPENINNDTIPIEQVNNDNYYTYNNEEERNELEKANKSRLQLKPKTKLKPPLNNNDNNTLKKKQCHNHNYNGDNSGDLISNDEKEEEKKMNSYKNKGKNLSENIFNLKTILDVNSNDVDNERLSNSCNRSANNHLIKIEKKIYDWLNNLSSSREDKSDLGGHQLKFNSKAQYLLDTIRRSTMGSSNELRQPIIDNNIKQSLPLRNSKGKASVNQIPSSIKNNKTIIGKTLLQKLKKIDTFFKGSNGDRLDDNKKKTDFKLTIPSHYYSKNNKKNIPPYNRNSPAFLARSNKITYDSLMNLNIITERSTKGAIMPPNSFDAVLQAREFFFFED